MNQKAAEDLNIRRIIFESRYTDMYQLNKLNF